MDKDTISIVSGLPRSGTSLMMSMLEAGGLGVLIDGIRTPDEDNCRQRGDGYPNEQNS